MQQNYPVSWGEYHGKGGQYENFDTASPVQHWVTEELVYAQRPPPLLTALNPIKAGQVPNLFLECSFEHRSRPVHQSLPWGSVQPPRRGALQAMTLRKCEHLAALLGGDRTPCLLVFF